MVKLMFKRKKNFNKRKRFNKKKTQKVSKTLMNTPKISKAFRKISVEVPIYAFYDADTTTYSYSFSAVTPNTYNWDINAPTGGSASSTNSFQLTDEFARMARTYNQYSIKGIQLKYKSTITGSAGVTIQWISLPDIGFVILPLETATALAAYASPSLIYASDSAYKVQTNQQSNLKSKYFAFPPVQQLAGGYCYGSDVYASPLTSSVTNYAVCLSMGWYQAPTVSPVPGVDQVTMVGIMEATFYTEWILPITYT